MPADAGYVGPHWVDLDDIDPRPAIDMRASEDAEAIADYAENFDELPHIKLVVDKEHKHWTADGSYRIRAARKLGLTKVLCMVKAGTYLDAFHDASRANGDKGNVRVTNADKQARVRAALAHPVMGKWSTTRIAEACDVVQQFVVMLHRRYHNGNVGVNSTTEGKDGKNYPATKPAMTRKQIAEKREEILGELQRDPTQPNTAIAEKCGVDWKMVKGVRSLNGIPPSGAKGGGGYHKPKASPTPSLPIREPDPIPVPHQAESPPDPPVQEAHSPDPSRPFGDRWAEFQAGVVVVFSRFPETERPQFAAKVGELSDFLFGLCPEVEDRTDQIFS